MINNAFEWFWWEIWISKAVGAAWESLAFRIYIEASVFVCNGRAATDDESEAPGLELKWITKPIYEIYATKAEVAGSSSITDTGK